MSCGGATGEWDGAEQVYERMEGGGGVVRRGRVGVVCSLLGATR